MKNHIVGVLLKNDTIHRHQYGFLPGRLTEDNLFFATQKIQRAVVSGHKVIVVACDFAKAFDSISFNFTINELFKVGLRGLLGRWFADWTKSNRFKTVNGDVSSDWYNILSGLKQGSAIGPLGFVVAINSLINLLPIGFTIFFADDQTLIVVIKNASVDIALVNELLEVCNKWTKQSDLNYNKNKCQYIFVPANNMKPIISIGDVILAQKQSIEILGVLFSGNRKNLFFHHQNRLIANLKAISYRILTRFRKASFAKKRMLYVVYLKSKLQYCSTIWSDYVFGEKFLTSLNGIYTSIFSGMKPTKKDIEKGRTAPMAGSRMISGLL